MCKKALVVGGTSGIGLSIALELSVMDYDKIYILGRTNPIEQLPINIEFIKFDLCDDNYEIFNSFKDIDSLIITAGFGKLDLFENLSDDYIVDSFKVNAIAPIRLINIYYDKILSNQDFNCVVVSSISGYVASPLFSVYSATKSSLSRFIENVNLEIELTGFKNRILDVAPGYIKGTGFEKRENNNINETKELARDILNSMFNKETLYIPNYEEVYKDVLRRYNNNPHKFGIESYNHKIETGRYSVNKNKKA